MTMVPSQNDKHNFRGGYGSYWGGTDRSSKSNYSSSTTTENSSSNFVHMSRLDQEEVEEGGYDHHQYNYTHNCSNNNNWLLLGGSDHLHHHYISPGLGLGPHNYISMAEQDESRTNSDLNDEEEQEQEQEQEEEAGSSSKIHHHHLHLHHQQQENRDVDDARSWLQLSIGGGQATTNYNNNKHDRDHHQDHDRPLSTDLTTTTTTTTSRSRSGLIELDLLPPGGGFQMRPPLGAAPGGAAVAAAPIFQVGPEFRAPRPVSSNFGMSGNSLISPSFFFQHHHHPAGSYGSSAPHPLHPHHQQQEISWAFRPVPQNIVAAAANSSSLSLSSSSLMPVLGMGIGSYFGRPFQLHTGGAAGGGGGGVDIAGPSSDVRVISPPRRPHSGIWFMLQASQNQVKEPILPQIPKSYLRIKDGRMTIRLLMKYLVNKLRLDSESEIEITCRGQQLLPFLTLQHVRDNIWTPRDAITLLPDSSTSDHVMVLHYARTP